MLTAHQCEYVAYYVRDSGEYTCRDCTVKATSLLSVQKAEKGLENAYGIEPIIRYTLDERSGENTWEAAEDRVSDFERDHPAIAAAVLTKDARWRLVDRVADRLGDAYAETCGECGATLD